MSQFERLIVCVDNSGSMGGQKIRNSISLLQGLVRSFNCKISYFKFGTQATEISQSQFNSLSCGGSTRIEYSLKQLFNTLLRKWSSYGDNTKFFFVTDACDSISDVNGTISAKNSCISSYNNKLDCECILVGSGGGCGNELKRIFGQYHQCPTNAFRQTLTKLTSGITKANNLSGVSANIDQEITSLKNSNQSNEQALGIKMANIQNAINSSKVKNEEIIQKVATTTVNIQKLEIRTTAVTQQVNTATTRTQIDRAETATKQLKREYRGEASNLAQTQIGLSEYQKQLKAEADKAAEMGTALSNKGDVVSQKASLIISNIIRSIKELNDIAIGARNQIISLKSKFNQQLDDLMDVVASNNELVLEFERVQENIDQSFKQYKNRGIELSELRQKIATNIRGLNELLKRLDQKQPTA